MYYITIYTIKKEDGDLIEIPSSIDIEYEKFLARQMVEEERKNDILHILRNKINIKFTNYVDKVVRFYNLQQSDQEQEY